MAEEQIIQDLEISNFRSIKHSEIEAIPRIMGIWGENGSGKSNLLQAIYLSIKHDNRHQPHKVQNILSEFHINNDIDMFNKELEQGQPFQINVNNDLIKTIGPGGQITQDGLNIKAEKAIYLPPWRHVLDKNSNLCLTSFKISSPIFLRQATRDNSEKNFDNG